MVTLKPILRHRHSFFNHYLTQETSFSFVFLLSPFSLPNVCIPVSPHLTDQHHLSWTSPGTLNSLVQALATSYSNWHSQIYRGPSQTRRRAYAPNPRSLILACATCLPRWAPWWSCVCKRRYRIAPRTRWGRCRASGYPPPSGWCASFPGPFAFTADLCRTGSGPAVSRETSLNAFSFDAQRCCPGSREAVRRGCSLTRRQACLVHQSHK